MELKPVKYSPAPKYPDKYEIALGKALLYYRPKSWLKKPIVGVALAALMASGAAGLTGCDIIPGRLSGDPQIAPIVYLSETDALNIIADELSNGGCEFTINDVNGALPTDGTGAQFVFDGEIANGAQNIDTEYVSKDDCINQKYPGLDYSQCENPDYCSTRDIAQQLKDAYPDDAIFSDPMARDQNSAEAALREQVQEFLQWLASVNMGA